MRPTIALAALLAGCVTISQEAEQVTLYSVQTNALGGCTRLGQVSSGDVALWAYGEFRDAAQQATNNLRDAARRTYGANAVVLINVDRVGSAVFAEGFAYKCE